MLNDVKEPLRVYYHQKIIQVVDGDGVIVQDIFSKKEREIRLLGIDAPEIKDCKKLRQDERELHLPGQLLIQLGWESKRYLVSILPINTNVSFVCELNNEIDLFGRTLAYIFIQNNVCINEILVSEGYVKPYDKFYCTELNKYRQMNFHAKTQKKGLYKLVQHF